MGTKNTLISQSPNFNDQSSIEVLPDDSSPVAIILAIACLIGAIAKLIQVLVPVMMKDQNRQ